MIVKTSDPALELTDRVPTFLRAGVIGAGWGWAVISILMASNRTMTGRARDIQQ